MKIHNMTSEKGNAIANQFIVEHNNAIFFQSYSSIIAKKEKGRVYLDREKWDYSKTTGKYRNMFLGETKKETEKKIKEGTYQLVNLNE